MILYMYGCSEEIGLPAAEHTNMVATKYGKSWDVRLCLTWESERGKVLFQLFQEFFGVVVLGKGSE